MLTASGLLALAIVFCLAISSSGEGCDGNVCPKHTTLKGIDIDPITVRAGVASVYLLQTGRTVSPSVHAVIDDAIDAPATASLKDKSDANDGARTNVTAYSIMFPHGVLVEILKIPERIYSISQDVPYNTLWEEVTTFPQRRPRTFNVLLATSKTWLADVFVQLNERRKLGSSGTWHFDSRRSASFALFGFLYIGAIQWLFYVTIFSVLCPNAIRFANESWIDKVADHQGRVDLFKQVFYDNFILETWIYFPIFYMLKELMREGASSLKEASAHTKAGLVRYSNNFKEDNLACWAIWIPADFAVFAAPMWMRMPLEHAVSFGWTMLLSSLRGGETTPKTAKTDGETEEAETAPKL